MRPDYLQTLEERRRRKNAWITWGGFFLAVYLICLLGLLFVLKTHFFDIKAIEVQGAGNISEGNIISLLQSQAIKSSWINRFLGRNNFLVWPTSFSQSELRLMPSLASAVIIKDYSAKKLTINIEERKPYGIWCLEQFNPPECLWFDNQGVMFKQAYASEGNLIRVVDDYYQKNVGMDNPVLPPDLLPNLFPILDVLQNSGLSIKEVGLYHLDLEELEVETYNGPKLLFSLRFPPQGALDVIQSLKAKPNFKNLVYIDFRVENRAYYK